MIREFKYEDINRVNELLKIFNYELNEKSFDNDFLKVLIYEDDIIKGVLVYQDLLDKLTIDYIIVDNLYRKNGIGKKLLMYMENKHNNIENITLEVRESNKIAIDFYKSNGFREVTNRKNYYGNEDAILMIKEFR